MADTWGPNFGNPGSSIKKNDTFDKNAAARVSQLMEKLRRKKINQSSWDDTNRLIKNSLVEKKHLSNDVVQPNLGKLLDELQKNFKAHGHRGVSERLERLGVSLGLRVTQTASSADHPFRPCVLEAECFRIEVVLDNGGTARKVRIHHDIDREPSAHCADLANIINEGKFEEVVEHISSLLDIYNIGLDRKQKSRVFSTLHALETDLMNLAKFQGSTNNVTNLILKTPVGIVVPRVAGRGMRLVYFVSPHELLDEKKQTINMLTIQGVREGGIGQSVVVCVEASSQHKLQNITLLSTKKQDGISLPSFMPLNKMNSCILPAIFMLRLNQPMPVARSVIMTMQDTTGVELSDFQELDYRPLSELIIVNITGTSPTEDNWLQVSLPDQKHSYALNCCSSCDDQLGAMVSCVPFLHPSNVARIIQQLRTQAMYNTVLGSCVRQHANIAEDDLLPFEVTAVSMQAVNVTFEHPFSDKVNTAMFDMSDITAVKCHVTSADGQKDSALDLASAKIFQRCLSLPVTMRYIAQTLADRMDDQVMPRSPSPPLAPVRFVPRSKLLHNPLQLSKMGQERRAAFAESRGIIRGDDGVISSGYASNNSRGSFNQQSTPGSGSSFIPPRPPSAGTNVMSINSIPTPISAHKAQMNLPMSSLPSPVGSAVSVHLSNISTNITTTSIPTPVQTNMSSNMTPAQAKTRITPPPTNRGGVSPTDPPNTNFGQGMTDHQNKFAEELEAIKKDKIQKNPMLASLLDQERESPEPVTNTQNSMLSQLLGEAPDPTSTSLPHKGPPNQSQMQLQPNKKRKRKSMADSRDSQGSLSSSLGGSVPGLQHQLASMSPKRLASEQDIISKGHYGGPMNPLGSANHPNLVPHPHPAQHPHMSPHHGMQVANMENNHSSQQHHPYHPHAHSQHNNVGGFNVNPLQAGPQQNHALHGPPPVNMNSIHPTAPMGALTNNGQVANFHSQTRVGGVNPLYHGSSSLQQSVTPSQSGSAQQAPQHSNTADLVSPSVCQSAPAAASTNTLTSSSHHPPNSAGTVVPGFEESHVSRLSSSMDTFIKQESSETQGNSSVTSNMLSNGSSSNNVGNCLSVVSTLVCSTSTVTSPKTVMTTAFSAHQTVMSSAHNNVTPSPSTVHLAHSQTPNMDMKASLHHQQQLQAQFLSSNSIGAKGNASMFKNQSLSELESLLNDDPGSNLSKSPHMGIKTENNIHDIQFGGFKDEKPGYSRQPSFSTVDPSFLKVDLKSEGDKGYDPFEFTETFLEPTTHVNHVSVDGASDSKHHSQISDMELNPEVKPVSSNSPPTTTPTLKRNLSSSSLKHEKEKAAYEQPSKNMYDHPKKERKKGNRGGADTEDSKDKLANVSMKININTKTNTIVRQSPSHRSESPVADISYRSNRYHGTNSTPDISQDSSRDSDVFIVASSASSSKISNNVESRHHHHNSHSHKSHSSSKSKSDTSDKKKKKSSRHNSEVRHERKRKRAAEEERLKAEQVKKQKAHVYDFDFNESEYMPPIKPTKIKIRTLDGQMQIQTSPSGTTKMSLSPLPLKASVSRSESESGRSSSKSHRSEKKHKHSSKNKVKSSTSDKRADKVDSKLVKTPIVKIKPLAESSSSKETAVKTPQSAPVRMNSAPHSDVAKSKTLREESPNMKHSNAALSGSTSPKVLNHVMLSDQSKSKSLSNLSDAGIADASKNDEINIQAGGFKIVVSGSNHNATDNKTIVVPANCVSDTKVNAALAKVTSRASNSSNCVLDKSRTVTSTVNSGSKSRTSTSDPSNSDRSKTPNLSSNGAIACQTSASGSDAKVRTVQGSDQKSRMKSVSGSSSSDQKQKSSGPNSVLDSSKSRPSQHNSSSDSSSKSRPSHNSTESRSKTPTQLSATEQGKNRASSGSAATTNTPGPASDSKNRSLSASAISSSLSNNSEAAPKGKTNCLEQKDSSRENRTSKHEKNVSSSSVNKLASATNKRKSSLSQIIDGLHKKGLGDGDAPQTQQSYDEIREKILAAGGSGQGSSLPKMKFGKKIGKIASASNSGAKSSPNINAKHSPSLPTKSVTGKNSPNVSTKSPSNSVNALNKSVSKQSSPNVLNKHGFNKDSNKTSGFRIPKSGENKTHAYKLDSRVAPDSKGNTNRYDQRPGSVDKIKNDPRRANLANDSSKTNSSSHSSGTDSKDLHSQHKKQSPSAGTSPHLQKHNSREAQEKSKRFSIDDISKRLQSEQQSSRHFLDAVVKPINEINSEVVKQKHGASPKYNSSHSQSNHEHPQKRAKSPLIKVPPNRGSPNQNSSQNPANKTTNKPFDSSQKHLQSNRSKTPVNMVKLKNSQISSVKPSSQELRKPEVALKPEVNSKPDADYSVPTSPPPTSVSFYNPAAALKKKPTSAALDNAATQPLARKSPVVVPLDKESKIIPLDKTAPVIPLDKVPSSSVTPSDTASSPIRHETPPASPPMGASVDSSTENKENVAKAIPLTEANRLNEGPASPDETPASPDAVTASAPQDLKTEPVIIASEKVVHKFESAKAPESPRSDISSPGLVIDDPDATQSKRASPKAIPLERDSVLSPQASDKLVSVQDVKSLSINKSNKTVEKSSTSEDAKSILVRRKSPIAIDDSLMNEALNCNE